MVNLFEPLPVIETEVFTSMPDSFRRPGARTEWAEANKGGAEVDCFIEGPSFDRGGNLYVVDIPFGRIFRISPAGEWALAAEYDGEPNGLKIQRDGRIFVADYRNGLLRLDPGSGRVVPVLPRRNSERFKGLNDLTFASNGDLYFTDQGQTGLHDPTGRVYRLSPDGRLDLPDRQRPQPQRPRPEPRGECAICGCHPRQQHLAHAPHAGRQCFEGGAVFPVFRQQRPGRPGPRPGGQPGGGSCQPGFGFPAEPARRADVPHPVVPGRDRDQCGLRGRPTVARSTSPSRRPGRFWSRACPYRGDRCTRTSEDTPFQPKEGP